jgi:hypothetical protein
MNAPARSRPTAAQLAQGGNDLLYEVQMLSNTAALLEDERRWNEGWGWQSLTLYMAVVESFLLHARALMDFLCPERRWEKQASNLDGLFAADYCTDRWRIEPWGDLREAHRQISKEVHHLTVDRPPVGRTWPTGDMRKKIGQALVRFTEDADLLSAGTKDQVRAIVERGVRVSKADMDAHHQSVAAALGLPGSTPTTTLIDSSQIEDASG